MIAAIGAVQGTAPSAYLQGTQSSAGADAFGSKLTGAIDDLQGLQGTSNDLAVKAVTGNLTDIHNATIASARAQVTLELVAAVRNKGLEAFNDILRMQA